MLNYVIANVQFVDKYLRANMPHIKLYMPQASFLLWLDCRELGLSHTDLVHLIQDKAGLALNSGIMFGKEGTGFMRMNIGCPRALVSRALTSFKSALAEI
jgi:cystathionine beta-lyase